MSCISLSAAFREYLEKAGALFIQQPLGKLPGKDK